MNKYLRHLLISALFDCFLLIATALSSGYIAYQFVSFHLLIIVAILFISIGFMFYKLYSVYYIEYPNHILSIKHEIYEIKSDINVLLVNNYFIKNKKMNKLIKKEIKKKEEFIKELEDSHV